MKRFWFWTLLIPAIGVASPAWPQSGAQLTDLATSNRIIYTAVVLTIASILPMLIVMVTSFTRFVIAFSFLRAGLGLQGAPANMVLISLSLFMTLYVMAPAFDASWRTGIKPLLDGQVPEAEAIEKAVQPFKKFMRDNVRERDLALFEELAPPELRRKDKGNRDELRILVPAFMISELRRGFEIGFLIVLPFLVIDMVGAIFAMAMGMMMLPPTVISLPFKVLFFILIDGWNLLVGALIRSFNV